MSPLAWLLLAALILATWGLFGSRIKRSLRHRRRRKSRGY